MLTWLHVTHAYMCANFGKLGDWERQHAVMGMQFPCLYMHFSSATSHSQSFIKLNEGMPRMYALHRIYTWSFCFKSLARTMQEMLWAALLEPAVWGDDESPKPVENAPDCCRVVGFVCFVLVFQYWTTLQNARSWEENWALPLVCCITRCPTIWIADRKSWLRVVWWPGDQRSQQHCGTLLCSVCTGAFQESLRVNSMPAFISFQHLQLVMCSGRRVGWLGTTRGAVVPNQVVETLWDTFLDGRSLMGRLL